LSGGSICDLLDPNTQCTAGDEFTVYFQRAEVIDSFGNPVPNAIVLSESGFNPNAAPEPSTFALLVSVLIAATVLKHVYQKRQTGD
jgi:hypothetical protein